MKLNDPFGRMERRHQAAYETMRDNLRRGGVLTPQAAEEIISLSKKRALKFIGTFMALLLLAYWLLPGALPVVFVLVLFLIVWVVISTVNGRRYIRRYIDEELRPR